MHISRSLFLVPILALFIQSAQGTLYFQDHFSYNVGNLGSVGSGGGWSSSNSGVTVTTNSLDGTPLGLSASSGNKVTTTTASSSGTYNEFSSGILSGNVYFSFLLRVKSASVNSGHVVLGLLKATSSSSYYADVVLRLNGTNVDAGLAKLRAVTNWSGTPLVVSNTYFVIGKYGFASGSANDVVSLWLNPPPTEGDEPTPSVTFTNGSDGNNSLGIGRCYIYGGASADIDELRIGSTWDNVAPTGGSVAPASAPYVTQTLIVPQGIVLRGTNGSANASYDLLTTTNVALPLSQWAVVANDTFNASGNFDLTNPVSPGAPRQFYRLRVGDGGSAVAPSITTQPQDQSVNVGQNASFSVGASGTAPLSYQWYFNTNTLLANGTSSVLALTNVQLSQAGVYSVVVANGAGSITSVVATLTVSNVMAPPSITMQPQNQIATEGQTVIFSVTATGTAPLSYQWYFNTNAPIVSATNSSLTLNSVSSNDAGGYSVIISNNLGSITSVVALLTVNPPSTNMPDFNHVGFGNQGFIVTGGAAGPTVYVGSESELQSYADINPPYTIYITNSFNLSGMSTHIRPNKTVIGLGNVVLSGGGLYLYRSTNVIIRNLTIQGSTEDNIGLHYSDHVWIDHCTILDSTDGGIDVTQESDYVTISWCKFLYTDTSNDHRFVCLLGASDGESGSIGKLHVTFHHNWWGNQCNQRMPSVRFGRAHVFNNYYNAPGNSYCVRSRLYAECRIENNYFDTVRNPWEVYITSSGPPVGKVFASGNTEVNTFYVGGTDSDGNTVLIVPGTDTVFAPPYSYALDTASSIPGIVSNNAGAGKGPFAP